MTYGHRQVGVISDMVCPSRSAQLRTGGRLRLAPCLGPMARGWWSSWSHFSPSHLSGPMRGSFVFGSLPPKPMLPGGVLLVSVMLSALGACLDPQCAGLVVISGSLFSGEVRLLVIRHNVRVRHSTPEMIPDARDR